MDTILPCLIARSSHNAPFASVAHGDWFATIIGIVALLDGGVKRIHIHMDDLPVHKHKYNGNLLHIKGKGCFIFFYKINLCESFASVALIATFF